MRVAFIIERNVHYQFLSPVIDEALARGWDVECWHDYAFPTLGVKAYQFPALESAPRFRHGMPMLKAYRGNEELCSWLLKRAVDVVVSMNTPPWFIRSWPPAGPIPRWVALQHVGDLFQNNGPAGLLACDAVAVYTNWWIRWAAGYLHDLGRLPDAPAFERRLTEKAWPVGFPELDQRRLVDPGLVKRRLGIPEGRPVVVYCPFPGAMSDGSFWARHVYMEPSAAKRVLRVLLHRRFEYARHVLDGWHDRNVLRAVREFCDRNGAVLIIKSRLKTPIPRHAEALADHCLYDESYYPATIIEVLSIADLCINFYSAVALEAVALGVPSLCVTFNAQDYYSWHPELFERFKRYFGPEHSRLFECPGVTTSMTIPEVLARLPAKRLEEFAFDEHARQEYLATHLGPQDGHSSSRVLDFAQRLVDRHSAALEEAAR